MPYSCTMISLGCPKNQVDAEIMLKKLADAGFDVTDSIESADVAIINTCGFIDDAKKEAIETILNVVQYKTDGSLGAVVVTGCLAERYQDEILKEIPEVDAVIGIGADSDIAKVCLKALCGIQTSFYPNKCNLPINDERLVSAPFHWAYLKIADGCDNRCAYCAIPSIRGRFRSRTIESIVHEAEQLVAGGAQELILVAQDTTFYGFDLYGRPALTDLLRALVKVDGLKWIRLYYCYPDRLNDELIDLIASEEKICNYIDLPLQHCSQPLLKSMHRYGSFDTLSVLIDKLRARIPDVTLRTTFMVGFPGETEADFEELCRFTERCRFDKLGVFTFSPEEGTPAFDYPNQIDESVKLQRFETLMDIQYSITEESNQKRVGRVYEAVIDRFEDGRYYARSYMDAPEIDAAIVLQSDQPLEIGTYCMVKICDFDGYDLIGSVLS